jgi:hypothetical protein
MFEGRPARKSCPKPQEGSLGTERPYFNPIIDIEIKFLKRNIQRP